MKKLLNTALLLFAVLMTSCTAPNAWELVSKDSNVGLLWRINKKMEVQCLVTLSFIKMEWRWRNLF